MGKIESRLLNWAVTALLGLLSVVSTYGTHLVSDMSKNLQELNEKMAVVITRMADQGEEIADLKHRVRALEDK